MDDLVTMEIPDYKDKLLQSLHQLQQKGFNCDVTLQAFDGVVNLHSIILAASSNSPLITQCKKIDCKKYGIHVVEALVVFLYSGEICIEEKHFDDFLKLCEDLILQAVCDKLKNYFTSIFDGMHTKSNSPSNKNEHLESENAEQDTKKTDTYEPTTNIETVTEGENMYLKIGGSSQPESEKCDMDSVNNHNDNNYGPFNRDILLQAENFVKKCISKSFQGKYLRHQDGDVTSHQEGAGPSSNNLHLDNTNIGECTTSVEEKVTIKVEPQDDGYFQDSEKGNYLTDTNNHTPSDPKKKFTLSSPKKCTKEKNNIAGPASSKKNKSGTSAGKSVETQDPDSDDMIFSQNSRKIFKCNPCNITFPNYTKHAQHMREVHRPYPCDLCDWIGIEQRLYARHMYGQHKVVIDPEKYPVVECDYEGCTYKCLQIMLYKHKKVHNKTDKLVCDQCGMDFTSASGLSHHMSYHKEAEMKHKCKQCGEVFGWEHELSKHVNAEHFSYKLCDKCPFKSKQKRTLLIHMNKVHGEPVPQKMKRFNCELCDYYCFYPNYLKVHNREYHSDEMNFKCTYCYEEFKTRKMLITHQASLHGVTEYKCDKCDYSTTVPGSLKTHKKSSHSEVKPFECHICEYKCKIKGNLTCHLRSVHKQDIPYKKFKTGKNEMDYIDSEKLYEYDDGSLPFPMETPPPEENSHLQDL